MKTLKDYLKRKKYLIKKQTKLAKLAKLAKEEEERQNRIARQNMPKFDDTKKIADKYNIPMNIWEALHYGIKLGFLNIADDKGQKQKYGISRENIFNIIDPDAVDKETLKKAIQELEDMGVKFQNETNDQWKKAKLKDPERE